VITRPHPGPATLVEALPLVGGAGGAQCAEAQVFEFGETAEGEAGGDEAAGVVGDGRSAIRSAGVSRRSRVPVHSAALVAYLAT
jgi:hypothetical protein